MPIYALRANRKLSIINDLSYSKVSGKAVTSASFFTFYRCAPAKKLVTIESTHLF